MKTKVPLVVLAMSAILAAPLSAGSTIDHELATISEVAVKVNVLHGVEVALGNEAVEQLKSAVSRRLQEQFKNAGVRVDDESGILFYCHIDAENRPEVPAWSALHVQAELAEPVRFVREVKWNPKFDPYATTWEFSMVQLVPKSELAEELANWAESLTESFLGDLGMARAWRERHPNEIPE